MPGNDQFKIIIDDSALDKVIEKGKKTSTELINSFNKASADLKTAFGKAFDPNQLNNFVTQVKSKLGALQSNLSFKPAVIDVDVSKISTAVGSVKNITAEIALLQSTAHTTATSMQGHFNSAINSIIQNVQKLQAERQKIDDSISASVAKGYKPLPSSGIAGLRIVDLKSQEKEAQSALVTLTKALSQIEQIQSGLNKAVTQINQTPSITSAVRRAISKGPTSGRDTAFHMDETSLELRAYAKQFQEKTGHLEDSISNSIEDMAASVNRQILNLPEISPEMSRARRKIIAAQEKELKAFRDELLGLKSKAGTSHDIIGALGGKDQLAMLTKMNEGSADYGNELAKNATKIDGYTVKLKSLMTKYSHLLEEKPEHMLVGGKRIIPRTPEATALTPIVRDVLPKEIAQLEKELAQLIALKDNSAKVLADIELVKGQIAYMKGGGPIKQGHEVLAGKPRSVGEAKKEYAGMGDPYKDSRAVETDEMYHQRRSGLEPVWTSSRQADSEREPLPIVGTAVRQDVESTKTVYETMVSSLRIADAARKLYSGKTQTPGYELPSAEMMKLQVDSIVREPILKPGSATMDYAERLKGSIGNATGFVKREFASTTTAAATSLFQFRDIISGIGTDVAKPWQAVIDQIIGVKDAAGKVHGGIYPKFNLGDQTKSGELVPYVKAFDERISRIQGLLSSVDTAPAETLPKLRSEINSLSTSLSGAGEHYRKINTSASEMSSSFRVKPLVDDLRNLFNNPDLTGHQLAQAQATVGQLNTKFSEMVKYAPALEPLRKQMQGLSTEFLKSRAFKVSVDPEELKTLEATAAKTLQSIETTRAQKPEGKRGYVTTSGPMLPDGTFPAPKPGKEYFDAAATVKMRDWQHNMDTLQKQYEEQMTRVQVARAVKPADQASVKAAFSQFDAGITPLAKQLNFSQVVSDALMQLARLARGAGDVGRNTSSMADQVNRLIELINTASTKGLTPKEGEALRKITADMDVYTVKLRSEHLPVVQTLTKEYKTFHDSIGTTVGRFLTSPGRGVLPELIRDKFPPPKFDKPPELEEWIENMSKGHDVFRSTGESFNKQWNIITKPPGSETGKALTVADMFGTGRLELIDQITAKTEGFGKAFSYAASRLGESGPQFESVYQPAMKSAELLGGFVQKLRAELLSTANVKPAMASTVLSLDAAQTSIGHTISSFKFLKAAIEKLEKSGGEVTPAWITKTQKGLEGISAASTKALGSQVQQFQGRLKGVLGAEDEGPSGSTPAQVYSAIKEAMKLPRSMSKEEPIASRGIGQMLLGGKKPLLDSVSIERVWQIKGALTEYVKEVHESGFGDKATKAALATVNRLHTEIQKNVAYRRSASIRKDPMKDFSWDVSPENMPSRNDPENTKMSIHTKGTFGTLTEGIQEAKPETYPDRSSLIEKSSKWSEALVNKRMVLLKRQMAKLNQEVSKDLDVGGMEFSASIEKKLEKGINFQKAYDALEKGKQKAFNDAERAKSRQVAVGKPPTEDQQNAIIVEKNLVPIFEKTKKEVVGSIDGMTVAKVAALKRQIEKMNEVKPGEAAAKIEKDTVDQIHALEKGSSGARDSTSSKMRQSIDPFAMLNNQIETIGYAINKQGQPLALWAEAAKAAKLQVMDLIKELAKTGSSTDYLDSQVKKFNATASSKDKVKTFSQLADEMTTVSSSLAFAQNDLREAQEGGSKKDLAAAHKRVNAELASANKLFIERERTIKATLTDEVLIADLHKRDVATIRELGLAHRMASLEARTTLGPRSLEAREEVAQSATAGRSVAVQSLVTSAWNTKGATAGGPFAGIGGPHATVDDVLQKIISTPAQTHEMLGPGIKDNIKTFRELNTSYELGVIEPKGLKNLPALFDKVTKAQEAGITLAPRYTAAFNRGMEGAQSFFTNIVNAFDKLSVSSGENQFTQKIVSGIQKARDEARSLIKEVELLTRTLDAASKREGTVGTRQSRIGLKELQGQMSERLQQTSIALEADEHAPVGLKKDIAAASVSLEKSGGNVLSLWERITNTVKTTRNNFADLFMYQVRWYTSMMLFWGVFNKVGETFKGLVDTQHQIQRAVRAMRDESGELVTHFGRLEKIATIHIFDSMIKWATDAKLAGEALWQLGSAGLNAAESIAALSPVVGLIRATEGDPQETVKIVAGVYNVLQDSIEGNVTAAAKFRIITDVMTKVFNDHQVELSELNQGYRYAITSADMAGLSFYELSGILGILNDNMIKGSRAGRGLQQVLTHIAKEPFAIAASFLELGKHMGVPAEAMAKLASPAIKKMGTMELLREFAKIAQASGKSIESLGRVMDSFDMIGGRTLAPLLLQFGKVDQTVKGLLFNSAGSTETMAARMSTTIQANLRRISSFFQASVYPVITTAHYMLSGLMTAIGSTALAMQGIQSKIVLGSFKIIGMESLGAGVDTAMKSFTLLGTIALLSSTLVPRLDPVGKALGFIGTKFGALFEVIGVGLASHSGTMSKFFSFSGIASLAGSSLDFIKSTAIYAKDAVISFAEASLTGVIRLAAAFKAGGIAGLITEIGLAFKALGLLIKAHPIFWAITAISLLVGGIATVFKIFSNSFDELVNQATEASAKYHETLGKLEQKSSAAFHSLSASAIAKESFDGLIKGAEGAAKATDEQKRAFDEYLQALLITDHTTLKHGASVQTLTDRLEQLTPRIDRNTAAMRGHQNALVMDKTLIEQYTEALKKRRIVEEEAEERVKKAAEKAKEKPGSAGTGTEVLGVAWDWVKGLAISGHYEKEMKARIKLRDDELRDSEDAQAAAQKDRVNEFTSRPISITKSPLQTQLEQLVKEGKDAKLIKKEMMELLEKPENIKAKDWRPKPIAGLDWDKTARQAFPDDKEVKALIKRPAVLDLMVGEDFRKEIEKFDPSKLADMARVKQLLLFGSLSAGAKPLVTTMMDTMKVTLGENLRKKELDARDKHSEALIKSEVNYHKEWVDLQLKLNAMRVSSIEEGYSAELYATQAFMLESRRLDLEHEAMKKEFAIKLAALNREHGGENEMDLPSVKSKYAQLANEQNTAEMKILSQRMDLTKKMGEDAAAKWQTGKGDVLKFENTMKAIQAREAEAKAGEKIASVERDIASSVRASAKEVQEAHRFKMEAIRLELAAKKGEAEYSMMSEKLKHEAEINALQDPEKRAQMKPEQAAWTDKRIAMLERQIAQGKAIHDATVSATDAASKRSFEVEEKRHQAMNLNKMLHDIKVFLGDIQEVEASARSIMSGFSAPSTGRLTSTMYDDRKGRPKGHLGGDISGAPNDPFYATADMTVKNISSKMSDASGGMVWGVDAQGIWHKFHHVKPGVTVGQRVKVGDPLGVLSDLGKGTHLDYKQSMGSPYGQPIDWMAQAGLSKGANLVARRATGNIPLSTPMGASKGGGDEDEFVDPRNLAEALRRLIAYGDKVIADEGPKAKGKLKPLVTEMLNGLKDMQIEPDQLNSFQSIFNSMEELWQKAGLKMKKFYPLIIDSFKKMFDKGLIIDIPLMVQYTSIARKAGETEEQIRKRVFESTKTSFENEENWTKAKMHSAVSAIAQLPAATGISGKRLDSFLFSEVFSPSKLQVMIDSDIGLMEMFYQELSQLSRNLTGGIPVKVMKSFETAIKGIISSGEELDITKYNALVNTLSQIPKINLKEAADSIEKYWQSIANSRTFSVADFGKMQDGMLRFGATQGEVWKAISDVADVQIRRMYASWDKGAQGMKGDMGSLKELGDAFWLGMVKGVADFASKLKDPIRQLAESVTSIMTTMQSTIESVLEDSLKGEFKGWNEYSTKFGESLIKLASKNMAESLMGSFSGLVGKVLGLPEAKKPGTMTQEEAEGAGKGKGEQQSRFNIEQTKINTESIKTDAKRTADGVEALVKQGDQAKAPGQDKGSGASAKAGAKEGSGAKGGVSEAPAGAGSPDVAETAQRSGLSLPATKSGKTGEYTTEDHLNPEKGPEMYAKWKETFGPAADKINEESKTRAGEKSETPLIGFDGKGYVAEEAPKTKLDQTLTPSITGEAASIDKGWFLNALDWINPSADKISEPIEPMMFARGGVVPGSGSSDSVPAMLTPGEIILSRSMVRRFAEGGDVENPMQSVLAGVGEMVQGMLAPVTKMMNPRAQQIAQIGEGNYGGTYEAQAKWDDEWEQVRGMYRQKDMQKYTQYQQQSIQQHLAKAEGGLIERFGLGGLVQFLATGGSVLQKDINPSLYAAHVDSKGNFKDSWPAAKVEDKPTPWWRTIMPLAVPLLLMGLLGKGKGAGAGKGAGGPDAATLKNELDTMKGPNLEPKAVDVLFKDSLTGATGQPGDLNTSWTNYLEKGKTPDLMSDVKLDKGLFDVSDLSSSVAKSATSAPAESGGFLSGLGNLFSGGSEGGGGVLSGVGGLFSSMFSGLGKIFSFFKGGIVPQKFAEGGGVGGLFSTGLGLVGSMFGPVGSILGSIGGSLLGGLFGGKKKDDSDSMSSGSSAGIGSMFGGGSGGGVLGGIGSIFGSIFGGIGKIFGFASGGPVIQTRTEAERPWQNMGNTATVETGTKKTWLESMMPYLMIGLPLLLKFMQGRKSPTGDSAPNLAGGLGEKLKSMKEPNLEPKSLESLYKDSLTGASDKPGDLNTAWTKYLEKGKTSDWLSDTKLDKSVTDITDLKASLAKATASTPAESGGFLSKLFGGGEGGGILSTIGGLGSSLWGGLKGILGSIGGIFGFAKGGIVPQKFAEGGGVGGLFSGLMGGSGAGTQGSGMIGGLFSTGLGLVGSMFGPVGSILGSLFGSLFGGLFGGGGSKEPKTTSSVVSGAAGGGPGFADGGLVDLLQKKRPDSGKGIIWDMALEEHGGKIGAALSAIQSYLPDFLNPNPKQKFAPGWSPEERAAEKRAHEGSEVALGGDIAKSRGLPEGYIPESWRNRGLPEEGYALGGLVNFINRARGFASGGTIPGSGDGDTVPAMLTPGEFVINKRTVGMFGPQFFHALQDLAKTRGGASPEVVLAGAQSTLKFASGGAVPRLPKVATAQTENKITVATVMDEESVGQFLNTKKYGEVLVNKLGSGITRRIQGGQGL
jgi:hypothetical protein